MKDQRFRICLKSLRTIFIATGLFMLGCMLHNANLLAQTVRITPDLLITLSYNVPPEYEDLSLHPLGRLKPEEILGIYVDAPAREAPPLIRTTFIDFDGDGIFAAEEVVFERGNGRPFETVVPLTDEHRELLHQDVPRTVKLRVIVGGPQVPGRGRGLSRIVRDFSVIFDPQPRKIAPIRLTGGDPSDEPLLPVFEVESGERHVIQFARLPNEEEQVKLQELGVDLLDYLTRRSWWARIDTNYDSLLGSTLAGGVVFVRPASRISRMSPELDPITGLFLASVPVEVAVHFFKDLSPAEMLEISAALGQYDIVREELGYSLAKIPPEDIKAVSQLPGVQWVERHVSEVVFDSLAGNEDHFVTPLHSPPYDLDGSGVNVAVFDKGWADESHPDLAGRVQHDPTLLNSRGIPVIANIEGHSTRMTGVIASSGVGNEDAIGVAPNVHVYNYIIADYYLDPDNMIQAQSALHNWRISNHSYSTIKPCDLSLPDCATSPLWGRYDVSAHHRDKWTYEHDILSIHSAGNKGVYKNFEAGWEDDNWFTTQGGPVGKNVVAVCAAGRYTYYTHPYEFEVLPNSSKGPTSDGRIKPDLCARGIPVGSNGLTLVPTLDGRYTTTQATSPAAAMVTGIAAILEQEYKNLHGQDAHIPPALAKALLIHTAEDMVEENTFRDWGGFFDSNTSPGPDYSTGWGFVNAQKAIETLDAASLQKSDSLRNGQSVEYIAKVPSMESLKVTVVWTDPPATVGTDVALINDLDLEIEVTVGGKVYYPWVLDGSQPLVAATTGVNSLDNVEQVIVYNDTSAALNYRIRLRGSSVPLGPQNFFLLSSHDLSESSPVVLYATSTKYNGAFGGRTGADAACRAEYSLSCPAGGQVRAVISISTEDEMRDMQFLYGIPANRPVVGSLGLLLSPRWDGIFGSELENTLQDATNLEVDSHYWAGTRFDGMASSDLAVPGSPYLCSGFTDTTSEYRASWGASYLTTSAEQFQIGWDGGNVYPGCSFELPLLCACWF